MTCIKPTNKKMYFDIGDFYMNKTVMKTEKADKFEKKTITACNYNFIIDSKCILPSDKKEEAFFTEKKTGELNSSSLGKNDGFVNRQLNIKDSNNNVTELSCIKKDYFFILEKKVNTGTKKVKNSSGE